MSITLFGKGSRRTRLNKLLADGNTVADYRADTGITGTLNASSWANNIGAAGPLLQATGAYQPIVLPFAGEKYLYLPGVAGNTLTSPNKSVTGSLSITLDVALNDYTPAADVTLFDKTSGNSGLALKWLTTDKLRLVVGDGSTLTSVDASVASGLTDASRHTIGVAWTDGVGASFTVDGAAWGTTVSAAKTLANASATATLGSSTSVCKLYRLAIGSVYDANVTAVAESTADGSTFGAPTGETWTLNSTGVNPAQVVGSASLLFNQQAQNFMAVTVSLPQPTCVYAVLRKIVHRSGDNVWDSATADKMQLAVGATEPIISMYSGSFSSTQSLPLGGYHALCALYNGAASRYDRDGVQSGALSCGNSASDGMTLGANPGGSSAASIQVKRVIIRNTADSAATRAQIAAYLKSIYGTP